MITVETGIKKTRIEDTYPLSPLQQGMLFNTLLDPGSGVDIEQLLFELHEALDVTAFQRAWRYVTARHPVLRTNFRWKDLEEPRQEVTAQIALPWDQQDWQGIAETERDKQFADLLTADRHRGFDLARVPLWRLTMLRYGEADWRLIWTFHHTILEGRSYRLVLQEVFKFYEGFCRGEEVTLPVPRPYRDYIEWLRQQDFGSSETFWRQTLKGFTTSTPLPIDQAAGAEIATNQGGHELRLSLETTSTLRALAQENQLTLNTIVQGAWAVLLSRYIGQSDVIFGVIRGARRSTIEGADAMIGLFLNTLPLRVLVRHQAALLPWLKEVRQQWMAMRDHEHTPLVNVQAWSEVPSSGSLFQSTVMFENYHLDTVLRNQGGAWSNRRVRLILQTNYSLNLSAFDGGELRLRLDIDRKRIDDVTAARLLHHLRTLLEGMAINPNQRVGELPLLEPAELEQLRAVGRCERPYARDCIVPDIFEDVVRRHGDATALVAGAVELSYSALDRRANAVAAVLYRAGIRRGDRVPLLLGRGLRFIASALGVLKCGAAFVPLDPAYPSERLTRMLDGLGARVGLCASIRELSTTGIRWLDASCADEENFSGAPPRKFSATDAAYVMFTSGSTGRPKGVEVPHRAIVRLVQAQDFARMGPQETWLHMAPTSFDASTLEIWAALLHGGRCVVLEESPAPGVLAETIRHHGVTSAWFTATLFNALVDVAPDAFRGLQQIIIGGEALSPEHVRRAFDQLPDVRFVNGYGPTENTTFTCCHLISRADIDSGRAIPIGRPIANTSVFVLDCDGRPAPLGMPGELVTGGDGIALGYVGQPAQTAERFIPDTLTGRIGGRLYRTGDRARWRADGVIEFLGRLDDQVKIRGFRIEPGEIEACLCEHADVLRAVVVPRRSSSGATQLVAYVVQRSSSSGSEIAEVLALHASRRLPAYMCPAEFVFVSNLPLKPNGKLDLKALEIAPQFSSQRAHDAPVPTASETKLLTIWRELLNNPELGVNDDFFASGGDSLLAMRMIVRVDRELGLVLPVRALVEGRTVRRSLLANAMRFVLPKGFVRVREGDSEHSLFCLPGLGGGALQLERLAAKLATHATVYGVESHNLDIELAALNSLAETAVVIAQCIRKVQPKGPYSILGYSYGGNLAVEVARTLSLDGEQIELLALLDAYAPGSIRKLRGIKKVPRLFQILGDMHWREACDYLTSRTLRKVWPDPEPKRPIFQSDVERADAKIIELGTHALRSYRPDPFHQRIVLVQATILENRNWTEIIDRSGTSGWSAICTGGVDLIPISCKHADLFTEPHLSKVARQLNRYLQ